MVEWLSVRVLHLSVRIETCIVKRREKHFRVWIAFEGTCEAGVERLKVYRSRERQKRRGFYSQEVIEINKMANSVVRCVSNV